jgi:hypothetical protein
MNRLNAALHLARRHPDFDTLAANMGLGADTLRKKLTGVEGYNWFMREEELLVMLCQSAGVRDSLAPLTAAAVNAGAVLFKLPESPPEGSPTFKCLADAAKQFGDFMSTAAEALADGKISLNELRDIERKFGALVAMGQTSIANMAAIHEAGKPLAEREGRAA